MARKRIYAEVCSFEPCGEPSRTKGLCQSHYMQVRLGQPLHPVNRRRQAKPCSVDRCGRGAIVRGLCDGHYQQLRNGQELSVLSVSREGCSVEGCTGKHEAKGYCSKHYDRVRAGKDPKARTRAEPSRYEVREDHIELHLDGKTDGIVSLVSLSDEEIIKGKRFWLTPTGYVGCKIEGRTTSLHRILAGLPVGDKMQVDHIDGNPLNNRRENLRIVTYAQNMQNKKPWGKTGHRGISFDEKKKLYRVQVVLNGVKHSGGRHKSLDDAVKAAAELRARLHTHNNEDRNAVDAAPPSGDDT